LRPKDSSIRKPLNGKGLRAAKQDSPQTAYTSAQQAVRQALDLGGSSGEAHIILAMFSWRYEWDRLAAEREFNNAMALAPSYDCGHAFSRTLSRLDASA
jgi:Tfp pilus assembly protein PilF